MASREMADRSPGNDETARRWVRWFVAWGVVGLGWAGGLLSLLSIGLIPLALATIGAVVLSRRREATMGLPGLLFGPATAFLGLAFLNRAGPGTVCTGGAINARRYPGDPPTSCTEYWNPYVLLTVATLFLASAVILQVVVTKRRSAHDLVPPKSAAPAG